MDVSERLYRALVHIVRVVQAEWAVVKKSNVIERGNRRANKFRVAFGQSMQILQNNKLFLADNFRYISR